MPTPNARPAARRTARPVLLAVSVTAALALTLAGCSGSSGTGTSGGDPSTATGQRGGGQRPPGVSGLIAAVSGTTMQVQSTSEQTAVTWNGRTRFTEVEKATAAALKTGLCASVRTAEAGASTGTGSATGPVAATSVTLSPAVDGACTGGFGGGGGNRPSGTPSGAPAGGAPTDAPSGAPSGGTPSGGPGGFGGRGANGLVTSVNGSGFVVRETRPASGSTTADVTVTTSSGTTWSELVEASAKAATVGRCATATGTTSGTGALTATTVRLSAPSSDGTCASFGGGRGPGQEQGQGQPGQGATANG